MEPFRIDIPDEALADLRQRLQRTRWPTEATAPPWEQGTPLEWLRPLVEYWTDGYDWRRAEEELNRCGQQVTEIDGQRIHLLHVRSPHAGALPLVLTHGWPGSVVEFLDVIGPLTDPPDPRDAFHVVVPALPGYGFSGPAGPGWHPGRIAQAWAVLMERLGYDRYGVQGGDWGSLVSANVASQEPERVVGLHLNFLGSPPGKGDSTSGSGTSRAARFAAAGSGYQQIQNTRPQTIGYLLDDSPAGLAGWILEKFHEWSDCGDDPLESFGRDRLLTNVMVYWLTRTGTSSARLYWEMRQAGRAALPAAPVTVPTGVARFPAEIVRANREWAEGRYRIVHWSELPRGGHFAAMEVPELFVDDVRKFFRMVR